MRSLFSFIFGVIAAAFLIAIGLLVVENARTERLTLVGNTFTADLSWLLVGATLAGFVLALLLVTPARAGMDRQSALMRSQQRTLEQNLQGVQSQHDQLLAEHGNLRSQLDQTVAERDVLNTRLSALTQERDLLQNRLTTMNNERAAHTAPTMPIRETMPDSAVTRGPANVVDERVVTQRAEEPVAAQPSLGERLRDALQSPKPSNGTMPQENVRHEDVTMVDHYNTTETPSNL